MPSDSQRDADLGRLCAAMWRSRLQLRWFRHKRLDMVRESLGSHYSEDAAEKATPINVMAMAERIIGNKLVPKNPRVMLETFERRFRPAVSIMEDWANGEIEHLNLANTFRRVVKDALYCVGIIKVAIATPADAQFADWTLQAGQPFIERIDLDDLVYDIHAKDWSECGYIGHRFRVPVEVVKNSKLYRVEHGAISGDYDEMFNHEGDERIGMIGRGYYSQEEEYAEFVDLWEVWDRRNGVIITLLDQGIGQGAMISSDTYAKPARKALRVQKWVGPDCGPYHFLGFNLPPGNPMSKGPLQDIYDLSMAINGLARKVIDQAQNTKRVTPVNSANVEDGKRINETPDGHACVITGDPKGIAQVLLNVPAQELVLLMDNFINRASWLMGNLELVGGLGPQAKTATQDKISSEASSANIGSMQDDTLSFVAKVLESWLWFHHYHPTNVHEVAHDLGHLGLPRVHMVRRSFPNNPAVHQNSPAASIRRSHSFEQMRMKVDPYSMQHQTPQQRAADLLDAVRNVYLPMAQLAMQQGVTLDLNVLFRKLGKYRDDPDWEEVFQFIEKPPQEPGQGGSGGAGVGPESTPGGSKEPTEIIRRSLGGDSQQAKEALGANMMAGAAGQNGQVRTIGGNAA